MLNLPNNFSQGTRILFELFWTCFWCGSNRADALHHIVGRGNKEDDCESSALNACPICNQKCHLPNHGLLTTPKEQTKLLNKTYDFLVASDYTFTDKDARFLEKYANLY
jgi:hypothetical protein